MTTRETDIPTGRGESPSDVLDITVLMGGPSSEREVSLISGQAVAEGLERAGHAVTRSDISPLDVSALDRKGVDAVFIALHGEFGESGEVQTLCEQRGLAYTGSGPRSSKLALNKAASKQLFRQAGLHTPDWAIIERFHGAGQYRSWLAEIGTPAVVKPVDGGSSVDVTIASEPAEVESALEALMDKYGRALVERFVPGREFTVGILDEQPLPVLEVVPDGRFYDYRAKYDDQAATAYRFDHGLAEDAARTLQTAALAAHRALGCRHLSRVDFIADESGTAWVLEINTIPGFTSHSLLPKAAQHSGIEFVDLVDRLARMAVRDRQGRR